MIILFLKDQILTYLLTFTHQQKINEEKKPKHDKAFILINKRYHYYEWESEMQTGEDVGKITRKTVVLEIWATTTEMKDTINLIRQKQNIKGVTPFKFQLRYIEQKTIRTLDAVSYTHLDVYKRQLH